MLIFTINQISGGDTITKISIDIDDELLEDLKKRALKTNSNYLDLVKECIEEELNNKGRDNMSMISINDNVMEKVNIMSKLTDRTPEEVVNETLWDTLRKVRDFPDEIDYDRIWDMLDHDKPEGDDVLEKLSRINKLLND